MGPSQPPDGRVVASPLGDEAVELAAMAGLELDDWQQYMLRLSSLTSDEKFWNPYTERTENKWAAKEVGVMISRQNGKGSLLEARELSGLFIFGERLIIHSAHQFDTSQEAFARILMLIESTPDLDREVYRVSRSHGEEGIEIKGRPGQPNPRLRFRTRTKGGGRGFTADCIVFDEAMYLAALQVSAILPTVSARPNPQIWYTGSAGNRESTQFGRIRSRALKGGDPSLVYGEWSIDPCTMFCLPDCDEHDDPDDPKSWAKANAGMGIRISHDAIAMERRSMDQESFNQERLGIGDWPVEGEGWVIIPQEAWEAQCDPRSLVVGKFALSIDTAPDGAWSCIAAAGAASEGGLVHVEVTGREDLLDYRPGYRWVVPRVLEVWKAQKPHCVVVDPASPAGALIDELESAGVNVIKATTREFAQACGDFKTGIAPRKNETATIVHIGQGPLTSAVANADKRTLLDLWAWSKVESSADITPLVASTLAVFGYKKHVFKKTSAPWAVRR